MRGRALISALLLASLGACQREPDFDERYAKASARIEQTAQEIDRQIAGTETPDAEAPR